MRLKIVKIRLYGKWFQKMLVSVKIDFSSSLLYIGVSWKTYLSFSVVKYVFLRHLQEYNELNKAFLVLVHCNLNPQKETFPFCSSDIPIAKYFLVLFRSLISDGFSLMHLLWTRDLQHLHSIPFKGFPSLHRQILQVILNLV